MKKILYFMMLAASVAVLTCCSAEDPFEDFVGNSNNSWNVGAQTSGNSATIGELTTFDVAIDKTTAEPTDAATAYLPDEEDALEDSDFSTEVSIDMSNPAAKTENGVEVTVSGGHVTANHGSEKKICYVVSGTTANGSLTILGDKKYAVKLSGTSITNSRLPGDTEPPPFEELTEEELEELLELVDYNTPLFGQLLGTGDDIPVYPFIAGGVGLAAVLVFLILGKKQKRAGGK